jgi:1-acyl-sn-glycerol-3-phosphate acyltransferase
MENEIANRKARIANEADPDLPPLTRTFLWRLCQEASRVITSVFHDYKAFGTKNVPQEGGLLILSNHQSFMDPPLVVAQLKRAVCFLARSGLFKPIGFGRLIRNLHAFPVERGRTNASTMKKMIHLVQSGRALLMFPEGTRSKNGDIKPLESGLALIIKRAGVPVVPVAIEGAYRVWPRTQLFPSSGKVRVNFGKPMTFEGVPANEIVGKVEAEIRRLQKELREMEGW